jgi:hypothetical protein
MTIDQAFRRLQPSENPLPDDDTNCLSTDRLANDDDRLASLRLVTTPPPDSEVRAAGTEHGPLLSDSCDDRPDGTEPPVGDTIRAGMGSPVSTSSRRLSDSSLQDGRGFIDDDEVDEDHLGFHVSVDATGDHTPRMRQEFRIDAFDVANSEFQ